MHLPEYFSYISYIVAYMLSPAWPFAYLLTFQGGQSKSIKGLFTFVCNNVKQIEGVMGHIQNIIPKNVFQCIMCGRFTPEQRILLYSSESVKIIFEACSARI